MDPAEEGAARREACEPAEEVETLQEVRETVGAAAWVVRETGRFNMVTEAGEVWTAAMCVAAAWGRADVVDWMNALGRGWFEEYAGCYLWAPPERLRYGGAMEAQARAAPHGADYHAAAARSEGAGMRPAGATSRAFEIFRERHNLDWATTLMAFSEEVCYEAGLDARDALGLEGARGVTEAYLLKAIGAQLVARRPLATELPLRAAGPAAGSRP